MPCVAGPQAQVHVLGEQVDALGSNGPSGAACSVRAARQAAIAQPTVRGVLGPVRLGALA